MLLNSCNSLHQAWPTFIIIIITIILIIIVVVVVIIIIIIIHIWNFHFSHAQLGLGVFPRYKSLHISLNTAHSWYTLSLSVSSFTHYSKSSCLFPHISHLPTTHFHRPTPSHLHDYVSHAKIFQSTTPHYTSATLWTPNRLFKTSILFLSFSNTSHILLTIIRFALFRPCIFSATIKLISSETHQRRWKFVCRTLDRHWYHRTWRTAFQSAIYWQIGHRWKDWNMTNVTKWFKI